MARNSSRGLFYLFHYNNNNYLRHTIYSHICDSCQVKTLKLIIVSAVNNKRIKIISIRPRNWVHQRDSIPMRPRSNYGLERGNARVVESVGLGFWWLRGDQRLRCDTCRLWIRSVMEFSQMFLEIEISAKAFAANMACERFLIVVRVHVKRQIIHLVRCDEKNMKKIK